MNQPNVTVAILKASEPSAAADLRFDKAFRELAPRVRGYLRRLAGGDTAEAEDVTQEVFLAAHIGRATYRGSAPPLSWLLGIARRRWRDRNRGLRLDTAEMPDDAAAGDDLEAAVVRATYLHACLDRLSGPEREALLLVFAQGLTYVEAAAELAQPVGTVKWRVHTASRRMREMLSAEDEDNRV